MDCDKNEATRLKLIAESKFEQKDFLGAKKYALIAQTLCPELYSISQLLTTLDVYLSAEKKIISGEVDWYGVLGVNPSDDYATIKKKYKKLALMLHPDKNSSVGADGGFQLILEASMMLLDNEKRAAYDERRGYKGFGQKVPTHTGGPSAPCRPHSNEVPENNDSQSVPNSGYKGFEQKVPTHTGGPSAPCRPHSNEVPENNDSQSVPNSGYKGFEQKVPTHTGGPSAPCRPHPNKVPEYNDSQSVPNQQKVPSAAPRRSQKKVPSAPPRPRQKKGPAHTSGPSAPPQPGQHKARVHTSGPSVPPQQKFSIDDRFFDLASWEASIPKSPNRNAKVPCTPKPAPPPHDTFWAACRECYAKHEYPKKFCNQVLICYGCLVSFIAVEIEVTVNFSETAKPVPWSRRKHSFRNLPSQNAYDPKSNVAAAQEPGPDRTSPNSPMYTNSQQGPPLHGTASTDSRYPSAEKPGNIVQQAHDNLKRSHASAGSEGRFKKEKLNYFMAQGKSDFATEGANGMGINGSSDTSDEPSSTGTVTPLPTGKMLTDTAQKEVQEKLQEVGE